MSDPEKTLLIVGVGAATGTAICRNMAQDHKIALVARSPNVIDRLAAEFEACSAYQCDVTDRDAWLNTLQRIEDRFGVPNRIVFNTEGGGMGTYDKIDVDAFAVSFPAMVTSLLMLAQNWFPPVLQANERLQLVINSSYAAYEPSPIFTGLGPARAAQRQLAEALRQTVEQEAIDIGLLAINGPIDEPQMRRLMADQPDSAFISPEAIAAKIRDIFDTPGFDFRHEITPGG